MTESYTNYRVYFPLCSPEGTLYPTDSHKYKFDNRKIMARTKYEAISRVYGQLMSLGDKRYPKDYSLYFAYTPFEWAANYGHPVLRDLISNNPDLKDLLDKQ